MSNTDTGAPPPPSAWEALSANIRAARSLGPAAVHFLTTGPNLKASLCWLAENLSDADYAMTMREVREELARRERPMATTTTKGT